MDQIACPVCTLYLREGMSLKSHLQTHPKNQVIEALVRLSAIPCDKEIIRSVSSRNPPQQPHVTSITYQQFLSSTTSFLNSSISPSPLISSNTPRLPPSGYNQRDFSLQQSNANYNQSYSPRPNSTIKYTQLNSYNSVDNEPVNPLMNEVSLVADCVNNIPALLKCSSKEKSYEDQARPFNNSEIGTVITDSHRVMTDSPIPVSISSNYSSEPKIGWEEAGFHTYQNDEAHSPCASYSSGCSVRVRKDLSEHSPRSDDHSLVQLTPPHREYILPCFDYTDENVEQDDDRASLNSHHSIGLNIHTDESMPPRGELSGQGTNSSDWQVNQENITNFRGLQDDCWRSNSNEAAAVHTCCSVCNKEFACPQEWRMHVSLYHEHPVITESTPPAEVIPLSHQDSFSSVFVKAEKVCVIEEVKKVKNEPNMVDSKDYKLKTKIRQKPLRICRTCNTSFGSSDEFKSHIRKVHPLECTVCGKCFLRHSGLTLHQKRHLKIKPYKCNLCDKSFVTNQKMLEHRHTHTGETPLKCPHCPKTFKRHSNLIQHRQFIHLKSKRKVKDFYCACGEVFQSKKKLEWHQETHDSKPKQCLYCNERFVHNASLTRHIRRCHDNSYLPKIKDCDGPRENVECPICHSIFLKGSLRNHILTHSGMKPFSCNTCGKKFLTKWNMKLHQWVHTARTAMPYKCKLCKAAFSRQSLYQMHLRSHKNVRPYSCNLCGRQFTHKYNCLRHVREHGETKMYRCDVCGKEFHRSYYLKDHMKVHTGVKPYSCHICSKTTATKTNHNKHLKTHHAREPVNSEH